METLKESAAINYLKHQKMRWYLSTGIRACIFFTLGIFFLLRRSPWDIYRFAIYAQSQPGSLEFLKFHPDFDNGSLCCFR